MLAGNLCRVVCLGHVNRVAHGQRRKHDGDRIVHQVHVAGLSSRTNAVNDEVRRYVREGLVLPGVKQRSSDRDGELRRPFLARKLPLEQMDEVGGVENNRGPEQALEFAGKIGPVWR